MKILIEAKAHSNSDSGDFKQLLKEELALLMQNKLLRYGITQESAENVEESSAEVPKYNKKPVDVTKPRQNYQKNFFKEKLKMHMSKCNL